jgi:DNA-binding CsgD family transcriptional regulator
MTGLTETEHVVAAFAAGSADYVTKPIRPPEVLARIVAHTRAAREIKQARGALDVMGQATLAIRPGTIGAAWQTPLAQRLVSEFFGGDERLLPTELLQWIGVIELARREGTEPPTFQRLKDGRRLLCNFHSQTPQGEWLLLLREESDQRAIDLLMQAFRLTQREADVLLWVSRGKTNRDIGDILGTSPRTVNKHLEHVFAKLGVETRTAAAGLASNRMRQSGEAV